MPSKSQAGYEKLHPQPMQNDLENGLPTTSWHEYFYDVLYRVEKSSNRLIWIAHVSLISLYQIITFTVLMRNVYFEHRLYTGNANEALYYSRAAEAVGFHSRTLPYLSMPGSKYVGNPSPELDRAWKELFRDRILRRYVLTRPGYNLRIPRDTLKKLNRTTIKLADESGDYWGSLEVFHHLHCLKAIRQYLAMDHYGEDNIRHEKPEGNVYPTHIGHCVERLREYLMCVPDLMIFTYDWVEGRDEGPMPNHAVKHACVSWEQLEEWVDARRFSYDDALIRQTDGILWPEQSGREHARRALNT